MRKLRFWLYLSVVFSSVILMAQPATSPDLNAIKLLYESGLHRNGILGSSLVLIRNGEVVLHDNYGVQSQSPSMPVNDDTTYHWASCTKTFTGIAIMQLRDRGLLSLDDPLIKYIPELGAVHDIYGPVSKITIRQMMSHSGAFRDPTWPWRDADWQPFEPTQWSQVVAMLPYTDVLVEPGKRFSYSNLGVVFLGEIIERLSGDPYEVYIDKNILKPLGMYRKYFDRSPYHLLRYRSHSWDLKDGKLTEDQFDFNTGITRSNGGLNPPLPDMIRYIQFLLGDPARQAEYEAILKRCSLQEMWSRFSLFRRTRILPRAPGPMTKWQAASSFIPRAICDSLAMRAGKTDFAATSTSIPQPVAHTSSPTTPTRKTRHTTLAVSISSCATSSSTASSVRTSPQRARHLQL